MKVLELGNISDVMNKWKERENSIMEKNESSISRKKKKSSNGKSLIVRKIVKNECFYSSSQLKLK